VICGKDFKKMEWIELVNLSWILYRSTWGNHLFSEFHHLSNFGEPFINIVHISGEHKKLEYFQQEGRFPAASDVPALGNDSALDNWLEFWSRILTTARSRRCALDEDKVRATLGLARRYRPPNVPEIDFENTGSTAEELNTWTSTIFLQMYSHLQQLSLIGDAVRSTSNSLPSWVVDLRSGFSGNPMTSIARFDATRTKFEPSAPPQILGGQLLLRGAKIGTIKEARGTWNDFSIAEMCLVHLLHLRPEYKATHQSKWEALWRTLILDSCGEVHMELKRPAEKTFGGDFGLGSKPLSSCSLPILD
jgi:hypothetical protein